MSRHVLIIGGSAAGLKCAARLRRLEPTWRITVLEKSTEYSNAACGFPFVLSGDLDDLDELRSTAWGAVRDGRFFSDVKDLEILEAHRATAIDPVRRIVEAEGPEGKVSLGWDELVIATGAVPVRLPFQPEHPRIRSFHTREDVRFLKKGLINGRIAKVTVIGAGLVGVELAEAFRVMWGLDVTLIEAAPHPLPGLLDAEGASLVRTAMTGAGVRLECGAPVDSIEADDEGVTVSFGPGTVRSDVCVVAAGVRPETDLARQAGVVLGKSGAIAVNQRLETSVPHIHAVGDCIEVRHAVTGELCYRPLGSLANRQGRALAGVLAGRGERFPPVAGAMTVGVFGLQAAAAGCTLAEARMRGFHAEAVWMTTDDCAHYWPESRDLHIQLVFEKETLRILGIQVLGEGRVKETIDPAVVFVTEGLSLEKVESVEHCYAPPFAPALAPVAVAAFVARNHVEGLRCLGPLSNFSPWRILDVRLPDEQKARPCRWPETVHIPIEELGSRLEELNRSARWLVICERGTRASEAVRRLQRRGVEAAYLGGGMIWRTRAMGERA